MKTEATPGNVRLNDGLGLLVDAEMAAFSDGAYAKHSDARSQLWDFARAVQAAEREQARTKALHDAARWVDELMGNYLTDGRSVEVTQVLMEARDMLKAHADMRAMTIKVKA